jgi:hypothetical protein
MSPGRSIASDSVFASTPVGDDDDELRDELDDDVLLDELLLDDDVVLLLEELVLTLSLSRVSRNASTAAAIRRSTITMAMTLSRLLRPGGGPTGPPGSGASGGTAGGMYEGVGIACVGSGATGWAIVGSGAGGGAATPVCSTGSVGA